MDIRKFIFSEKRKDRVIRHVVFWLVWWAYFGFMHALNPFLIPEASYFRRTPFTLLESLLMLVPQMYLIYVTLGLILPLYLKKKQIFFPILLWIALWFSSAWLNHFMITKVNPVVLTWLLPDNLLANTTRPPGINFFMAMLGSFKGGLTAMAFTLSLRFIKQWYLKEQKNIQLQKENMQAQLQLLTAQVHPHFLFNTLNNIYSQTQTESPKGSSMIISLSELLRYILYEGNKPLVPLDQELKMIREYIKLEKIRYGNQLDVHMLTPDKTDNIYIAPLLILPFIENCFKHGTSRMLDKPWINLTIELKGETLVMKLMNGKTSAADTNRKSGIGIRNVRQRLELLYKGKYELKIRDEEEVFVVDLQVQLQKLRSEHVVEPKTAIAYA